MARGCHRGARSVRPAVLSPDSPAPGRSADQRDDARSDRPISNIGRLLSCCSPVRLFREVWDEPEVAEPATPLFISIITLFVLSNLVAFENGGDVLAILGLDFVAAAALVAAPRFLITGVVEEFDDWWLQSSFVHRQRRLGRAFRRLNRLATLAACFFFLPLLVVFTVLYLIFVWDPFVVLSSYSFVALVLIGPVALFSDLLFTRETRIRRREADEGASPPDQPMTLKTVWRASQQSPWAPALALGLLVVGVVLQILATAF
jgi:hypothetical protein